MIVDDQWLLACDQLVNEPRSHRELVDDRSGVRHDEAVELVERLHLVGERSVDQVHEQLGGKARFAQCVAGVQRVRT